MDVAGKKIIITGGTGFIGTHLVNQLAADGAELVVLTRSERSDDRENVEYVQFDLSASTTEDYERVANEVGATDYAIFAAASILPRSEGTESILTAKENNMDTFLYFLDSFGKQTKKVVYTSTIDTYGIPTEEEYDENAPKQPISTYGVAKYCGEKYLELWSKMNDNLPYTILRFSQVYGPHEPPVRVIPFIFKSAKTGGEFTLMGGGKDKRRFLYVTDAVASIYAAMDKDTNDYFNIAGSDVTTIGEVVETVQRLMGITMNLKELPAEKPPTHNVPSIEKARTILGFEPSVSFEEGIQTIITEEKEA